MTVDADPLLSVPAARRMPVRITPVRERPINVLIGADSLTIPRSGVGRMTLEIARAARASSQIDWTGLLVAQSVEPADLLDRIDTPATPPPPPKPIAWKVAVGRLPGVQTLRRIKHGGLNRRIGQMSRACGGQLLYHEPNMIARPVRLPTVVTINDLSWLHHPDWHPSDRLRWIDTNLKSTLRQARRFVAISQFTKDAVIRDLHVPADRIDVIPLAPAEDFRPVSRAEGAAVLASYDLADRAYVFSISTIEPRKNFDRLLDAHLSLPAAIRQRVPLVIAGGKGWGDVLARPAADAAIRDGSVRLLGHVADDELVVLTARAAVFAYVSLYEGFGLPVVEAMAAGVPVVASSTTAVGELALGAAWLVDPQDTDSIREGLRRVIEDRDLADSLRRKGLQRAALYTWGRTIDTLLHSWRLALP